MKQLKYFTYRDFQKMNISIQKLFWEKEYSNYEHFLKEKGNKFIQTVNAYLEKNNIDKNKVNNYIYNILFLGFKNHQKERAVKELFELKGWKVTPTNDFENTILKIDLKAYKNEKWIYIQVKPNGNYKANLNEFKRLFDFISKENKNIIAVLCWIENDKLYLKQIKEEN